MGGFHKIKFQFQTPGVASYPDWSQNPILELRRSWVPARSGGAVYPATKRICPAVPKKKRSGIASILNRKTA